MTHAQRISSSKQLMESSRQMIAKSKRDMDYCWLALLRKKRKQMVLAKKEK